VQSCGQVRSGSIEDMKRAQLVVLMTQRGGEGASVEPELAIAFLADYLARMHGVISQTDHDGLLYAGSAIWQMLRDSER